MSTTESTARARYCFQLRTDAPLTGMAHCVASDCMAWRWMAEGSDRRRIVCPYRHATTEDGMTRPAMAASWIFAPYDGSDYPAQWLEPEADQQARRRGYCGLAGMPVRA